MPGYDIEYAGASEIEIEREKKAISVIKYDNNLILITMINYLLDKILIILKLNKKTYHKILELEDILRERIEIAVQGEQLVETILGKYDTLVTRYTPAVYMKKYEFPLMERAMNLIINFLDTTYKKLNDYFLIKIPTSETDSIKIETIRENNERINIILGQFNLLLEYIKHNNDNSNLHSRYVPLNLESTKIRLVDYGFGPSMSNYLIQKVGQLDSSKKDIDLNEMLRAAAAGTDLDITELIENIDELLDLYMELLEAEYYAPPDNIFGFSEEGQGYKEIVDDLNPGWDDSEPEPEEPQLRGSYFPSWLNPLSWVSQNVPNEDPPPTKKTRGSKKTKKKIKTKT